MHLLPPGGFFFFPQARPGLRQDDVDSDAKMTQKFTLEFILHVYEGSSKTIKNALTEFGDSLEITECQDEPEKGKDFKISVNTEDPTLIFDICSQFGRIKSVKVNEEDR